MHAHVGTHRASVCRTKAVYAQYICLACQVRLFFGDTADVSESGLTELAAMYIGLQAIALDFSVLPKGWLPTPASVTCDAFDIFATAGSGKNVGRIRSLSYAPVIPPHGIKFLLLGNCTIAQ